MTFDPEDPHAGLTCAEMVRLVTDYLEEALPPEDRRRFEVHLSNCEDCGVHLEQMRLTIAALGRLGTESIPPRAERDLLEAFRSWKRG